MWLYLERLSEYVAKAQPYTQTQLAKECHIARGTVSAWRRDPRFRAELARVLRETANPEIELATLAMLRLAQRGSVKAFEAVMRSLGRMDSDLPTDAPSTEVKVGVAFYGLPTPPTPAEAERLRPPAGAVVASGNGSGGNGSKP